MSKKIKRKQSKTDHWHAERWAAVSTMAMSVGLFGLLCFQVWISKQKFTCNLASGCSSSGYHATEKQNIWPDHTAMVKCVLLHYCVHCSANICIKSECIIKAIVQKYSRAGRHSSRSGKFQGWVGLIRWIILKHQSPYYKRRDDIQMDSGQTVCNNITD